MAFKPQSEDESAMSEINVTPLVDVMLVLVIILLVTAPLLTQSVHVTLPKTAETAAKSAIGLLLMVIAPCASMPSCKGCALISAVVSAVFGNLT